ncbi:TFIIS helical bundle-like domain protein [Cryptosporidium meleagridis]|uniref:TFIIS helical bundle-like domain protein n=1 Tax=Cryptosporidium meleagridis TaxID=93969 RepID=A0A2P4Z6P5_9CRYT|nr:TFIIS helical bundle-like domain protein [Cryptosporidium meleagridis]
MVEASEFDSGISNNRTARIGESIIDVESVTSEQFNSNIFSEKGQEQKNLHEIKRKKRKVKKHSSQIHVNDEKNNKFVSPNNDDLRVDDFIVEDGTSDFDEDDIIRVEGGIKSSDDEYDEKIRNDFIEETSLNAHKNSLGRKFSEVEIRNEIREFIQLMKDAANKDEIAYSDGKVAISKLKMIDEVFKRVSMNNQSNYFISEGVLDVLSQWLSPFKDGTLPNLSIRNKILKLISSIPLGEEDVTSTELGKTLCKLWKNPAETIENRQIIRTLIQRWVRLISKDRPSSLEAISKVPATPESLKSQIKSNNNESNSKKSSFHIEPRTARIPINTGYNFKVIPQNDSSSIEHNTSAFTDKSIGNISINRSSRTRNRSKHAMKISLEGKGL